MGKREKKVKAQEHSSSEEDRRKRKALVEAVDSDDEANEDLSLRIVQKAMQRAVRKDPREDGVSEIVMDLKEKKKKKKEKRKKAKEIETLEISVPSEIDTGFREFCGDLVDNVMDEDTLKDEKIVKDGEEPETHKATEVSNKAVETNPVEASDNAVLRKLLRGPRYFDPPDGSWRACYNCGEEGHMTANCTSAKRKKPCFVCGSFEHNAKQCSKGQDCFICKQQGHRAKDCPDKYNSSKICLKCGDSGHEMFSCRNEYSPDDLKDIQCYICGTFGHLCCINYSDSYPTEVSCYRCGLSGHTGLACMGSHWDTHNSATASSCYKCGLEGHFARECSSSVKSVKRHREPSTPKKRYSKKNKDCKEPHSEPHDIGKTRKKRKSQFGEFASASKAKYERGWTTEQPEDYYYSHAASADNWSHNRDRYTSSNGNYASNSYSSQKNRKVNFHNSPANGSSRSHQNRYSASRFNYYNGHDSRGRSSNWW
ncbi:zinc knuckle family protein [Striga asiatica]|uniref:Zinc knuckle family protein n=1 Tax=Striga asiatica TaxID=4170 RepID=A0A5A7PFY7_STRAF|nr:zinc knuckle family protein [Striga asiatica]